MKHQLKMTTNNLVILQQNYQYYDTLKRNKLINDRTYGAFLQRICKYSQMQHSIFANEHTFNKLLSIKNQSFIGISRTHPTLPNQYKMILNKEENTILFTSNLRTDRLETAPVSIAFLCKNKKPKNPGSFLVNTTRHILDDDIDSSIVVDERTALFTATSLKQAYYTLLNVRCVFVDQEVEEFSNQLIINLNNTYKESGISFQQWRLIDFELNQSGCSISDMSDQLTISIGSYDPSIYDELGNTAETFLKNATLF
jgi:hypothetical protein